MARRHGAFRFGFAVLLCAAVAMGSARDGRADEPQLDRAKADPSYAVRRGLVTIEKGGKAFAVGSVLAGDGRILTTLAPLLAFDVVDIRYADNSIVHARVQHRDTHWNLALLLPSSLRWTEGLKRSVADPLTSDLTTLSMGGVGSFSFIKTTSPRRFSVRSKSGEVLQGALELEFRSSLPAVIPVVGAPLLDRDGWVIGLMDLACMPSESSLRTPLFVGIPNAALQQFLMSAPGARPPLLGMAGAPNTGSRIKGVRVVAVAPGSPADRAGLSAGSSPAAADVVVAVDGTPVDTPERLSDIIAHHAPGDTVNFLVFGGKKFREVPVTLQLAQ